MATRCSIAGSRSNGTRFADGSWFNSYSHGIFEGRKLLEPMPVCTRSESSNLGQASLASQ